MDLILNVLLVIVVGGFIAWVINEAPFIEGRFKQMGVFAILVVCVVIIIKMLLPSIHF
jgi:cation transporter-like permease